MNMLKHSFENHILFSELVDFSKLKSNTLVDFSKLKSFKTIELLDFSLLKSRDLVDFNKLKSYKSIKLLDFSRLKSRTPVDFSTVSLYQTKVQLPTGLWYFTRLKSRDPVGFQGGPVWAVTWGLYGWVLRAGELEAGAGNKLQAGAASWDGELELEAETTKNLT